IGDDEPRLSFPDSVAVNADAGGVTAQVTWDPVSVSGGCDAELGLVCTATHSFGVTIDHLIETGGRFPPGLSEFECTTTDMCGLTASCEWRVNVSPATTVELTVQLSPTMTPGPLHRCIEFEFYSNCVEPPLVEELTLEFGLPYNLPGYATNVVTKVPAGQYACVTARDPLHTLRSVAGLEIVDRRYVVTFEGDPFFGGNWLVGGNLNGDHVIDILDFGTYLSQYGLTVDADTPCGTEGPHADLDGDGEVNEDDMWFVETNLGQHDKDSCCPGGVSTALTPPIVEISVRDLELMGLDHLDCADLNGDGLLNQDDVAVFSRGGLKGKKKPDRDRDRN
ncbi:MAG: hypothetical protein WBE26_15215, partial [Phycisphaerae bacterium]